MYKSAIPFAAAFLCATMSPAAQSPKPEVAKEPAVGSKMPEVVPAGEHYVLFDKAGKQLATLGPGQGAPTAMKKTMNCVMIMCPDGFHNARCWVCR